ncbi:hypothetical protein Ddc_01739 [Ditylenchus destructor]|nr:hypothetical protein Ddc_01739 [Ditylenchus destructor]
MFAAEVGSDELVDGEGRKSCIINPGDGKFRRQPEVPPRLAVAFALNKNGMCQRRGETRWVLLRRCGIGYPLFTITLFSFPGRARAKVLSGPLPTLSSGVGWGGW